MAYDDPNPYKLPEQMTLRRFVRKLILNVIKTIFHSLVRYGASPIQRIIQAYYKSLMFRLLKARDQKLIRWHLNQLLFLPEEEREALQAYNRLTPPACRSLTMPWFTLIMPRFLHRFLQKSIRKALWRNIVLPMHADKPLIPGTLYIQLLLETGKKAYELYFSYTRDDFIFGKYSIQNPIQTQEILEQGIQQATETITAQLQKILFAKDSPITAEF